MLTHCAANDTQQEIFNAWCLIFIGCLIESHAEKFPIQNFCIYTVYYLLETLFFILGPE